MEELDIAVKQFSLGVDVDYLSKKIPLKKSTIRKYLSQMVASGMVRRSQIPGISKRYIYKPYAPEPEEQRCFQCSQGWDLGQANKGIWHCPIKGREVSNEAGEKCDHFIYSRKKSNQAPHLKGSGPDSSK